MTATRVALTLAVLAAGLLLATGNTNPAVYAVLGLAGLALAATAPVTPGAMRGRAQ